MYSLNGSLVPGSSGWYGCSYGVANPFSSFNPLFNSSIGHPKGEEVLGPAKAGPLSVEECQGREAG